MQVADENAMSGAGRDYRFPDFIAKQYEWFHYVEMAEKLHLDVGALKSRGVGWSEMTASMCVRPYTTKRGYNVMVTAGDQVKLDGTKLKCWYQLDWLNMNTQGGMRHIRQKFNNDETKKASLVSVDGIEYGWQSMITTVIANTPDKIRGPRLDRLVYEEAGSNRALTASWIKGNALVNIGGVKLGTKIFLGTGGDEIAINGISELFSKPEAYGILPYKNYDTDDGRPEITAFFLPAHKFSRLSKYVDNRGVTNYIEFKKVYEEIRSKLTDKAYLDEAAEHCFTPREALSKHGDNVFDPVAIAERLVQIKVHNQYIKPKRMQLLWDKSKGDGMTNIIARESVSSHLLVVEPPLIDAETGKPYKNLYVAGIDAIDMGRKDSATDTDVSDFCIVIKKRVFGMEDPKYVAIYKFRPDDIRQAYDISLKLLMWYNCKAMLEYTKISIQTYFREKGKANLFMTRPKFAVTTNKPNKTLIGIPGTEAVIQHGLELISNFVNDYWHTIDYEEMLDQLLNYSYENKRKFDIIAAMQMAEIADEELSGITPTVVDSIKSQWKDIGYYIDENGYKRKGIIPPNRSVWRL